MAEYRLGFDADTGAAIRSINELQKVISKVAKDFNEAEVGSREFARTASELSQLTLGLKTARGAVVDIDKAYRDLNKAVEANFAAHTKATSAATKYHKDVLQLAQESAKEEDRLRSKNFQAEQDDWDRRLKLAVAAKNKIAAQEKAIMEFRAGMGAKGAIPEIASPIRGGINFPDSPDYKKAMADAAAKAAREAKASGGVTIPAELKFQPFSLADYESKLKALSAQARLIAPKSEKWKSLNKQILEAERGIAKIQKRQRLGPTMGQRASAAGGAFLYGGGLSGGVGSALGGIGGGLLGGVPGAFAGAAIGQAVDNLGTALAGITSQASKVQQLQRGLALASIDAKDFAEAQAAVADVSTRLFIPLEQVTKSFSQLRVNTKQYGLSVEETKQILEGTILAVSAFGGSADDVDGAMRAVVQILSKGSVQAEELRGQLGERFPGAVIKFAQANKLSFDELQNRLKEGTIGIKEFVTFAEKNYEDYAEFSKKLATAPEFAGRRLQIALEQISLEIGGLFGPMGADIQDLLTSTINNIAQFIKDNRGYLRQMISDFSSIVGPIAKVFVELMKVIANFSVQVGKIFQGLFASIRQALGMASIGEAKARLDRAKAATAGKTRPTRNARGGGTTTSAEFIELEAAQRAFSGLGGQAAFNKANAPAQLSDLVFGGPGAGMDMSGLGGGGGGGGGADKAAEQAARAEQQIQERLRGLTREIELNGQIGIIKELQFQAEMDGNKELQARLQGEERITQIMQSTARSLDGITDQRLQQKILAKAEGEILIARQDTALEMQRIEAERTKLFDEIIAGLDLELALKSATTEQAREQLRLESEIAKLPGQGFTREQIGAITAKKTELAAPKTDQQNITAKIATLKGEIADLTSISNIAITSAEGIGNAFAQSFQGLISGTMTAKEALGSFFKSVADMFLEMAAQIIAKQITMIILQTILKALGAFGGGGGGSDYSGAFKSTPGTSFGDALKMPKLAANGATFANGIAKFANGGAFSNAIVTAPTMFKFADGGAMKAGLMGEAGPEAIMPLSRGAGGRLGVDASGLREAMDRQSGGGNGSPVLNMSFQSTSINGVEYVSRDQLEQAMAETRRASTRDGAKRGMTMTLDRIQNSSSTRRKVGI